MPNGMVGMLLVLGCLTAHQFETVIIKRYGKSHGKSGMLFNAIVCLFAMIYFFITDKGGLHFARGIWGYGIINSFLYAIGFYSAYGALRTGSFGLTRLFVSFGVIISTFYGILFLNEPTSPLTYIALVLILVSLTLMNYQKQDNSTSQKISLKWVIYVLLIVLSNAANTILGRMQYGVYGDAYNNEFLIISLAGAAIFLFLSGAIFERDSFASTMKHGLLYGAAAGIFNGINNLLGLVTYNYLPISFTSPVKAGLGLVVSFLLSVFLYKEKFSRRQLISTLIGGIAVVMMNIEL